MTNTTELRIYVANLGKYNEGELVGAWFTLPHDIEDIYVQIGVGKLDKDGNYSHGVDEDGRLYEEWAIHDHESPFSISEYASISKLNEIAEKMESMQEQEIAIALTLLENGVASDFLDGCEKSTDVIVYDDCEDMEDVAKFYYENISFVEEEVKSHYLFDFIDWEQVGKDMDSTGSYYYVENYNMYIQYLD